MASMAMVSPTLRRLSVYPKMALYRLRRSMRASEVLVADAFLLRRSWEGDS